MPGLPSRVLEGRRTCVGYEVDNDDYYYDDDVARCESGDVVEDFSTARNETTLLRWILLPDRVLALRDRSREATFPVVFAVARNSSRPLVARVYRLIFVTFLFLRPARSTRSLLCVSVDTPFFTHLLYFISWHILAFLNLSNFYKY